MQWYEMQDGESPVEAEDRRLLSMPILDAAERDTLYACRQACWDGNLPSKRGRDSLFRKGLIVKYQGWQVVSAEGLAWLVVMKRVRA